MDNLGPVLAWYLLGFALIVAELFIPGAVVGIAGTLVLLYSLYLAFTTCPVWVGLALVAGAAVGIPYLIAWGTRRLSIKHEMTEQAGYTVRAQDLGALVGKEGEAEGLLRPEGAVQVDGRRYDGKAELGFIEKGARVEVVGVYGSALVVRQKKA